MITLLPTPRRVYITLPVVLKVTPYDIHTEATIKVVDFVTKNHRDPLPGTTLITIITNILDKGNVPYKLITDQTWEYNKEGTGVLSLEEINAYGEVILELSYIGISAEDFEAYSIELFQVK